MNLVIWKNYLDGQILYRSLVPPIKNGVNGSFHYIFPGQFLSSVFRPKDPAREKNSFCSKSSLARDIAILQILMQTN